MGIYNSVYVGVYMELAHSVREKIYSVRIHPDTKKEMKGKFCPNTGKEGIVVSKVRTIDVKPSPYIENHPTLNEDEFFNPAYTGDNDKIETFICNDSTNKFRLIQDDDVFNLDLSSIDTQNLINDFIIEYKDYINYYEKTFNTKVIIKFGVVFYAH